MQWLIYFDHILQFVLVSLLLTLDAYRIVLSLFFAFLACEMWLCNSI